jgi:hypothetical protein
MPEPTREKITFEDYRRLVLENDDLKREVAWLREDRDVLRAILGKLPQEQVGRARNEVIREALDA